MTDFDIAIHQGRTPDLPPADANVVIDVLRAFTTTHVAFRRGATEVLLAREVERAFELKERHPDYVLAGERDARRVEGFDLGNSPAEFAQTDLEGRGIILTTTNGVRATTHALEADEVLVCGWSNTPTLVDYLGDRPGGTLRLNLVASHPVSDEDLACAEYIAARLQNRTRPTATEVLGRIREARSAQKFTDATDWDREDLEIALERHDSEFVMRVVDGGEAPKIIRASA